MRAIGGEAPLPLFAGIEGEAEEAPVALPPMTLGEEIVADYVALRLTLRAHPDGADPAAARGAGGTRSSTGARRSADSRPDRASEQAPADLPDVNECKEAERMSEKPPILFLHGAFGGPEVWTRFVAPWFAGRGHQVAAPRLADAAAGRRRGCATTCARAGDGGRRARRRRRWWSAIRWAGWSRSTSRRGGGWRGWCSSPRRGPAGSRRRSGSSPSRAPDVLATLLARAGGRRGAARARGGAAGALHRGDAGRLGRATSPPCPTRESPLALLDGLTWDLPAWFLVRRAPVLALLGDRDAFVPVTDLWAIALAYGAETELMRGVRPRAADRPALEEPGLADQRLDGRAADRRRGCRGGRIGADWMKAIAFGR